MDSVELPSMPGDGVSYCNELNMPHTYAVMKYELGMQRARTNYHKVSYLTNISVSFNNLEWYFRKDVIYLLIKLLSLIMPHCPWFLSIKASFYMYVIH